MYHHSYVRVLVDRIVPRCHLSKPSHWLFMIPCSRLCMKPVLLSLCLIVLFMTGTVSASLEDCPTCGFAYDPDGSLADTNPYAGCPTCIFAYDANGSLITNAHTGCTSCAVSSGMTTNTLGGCSSCTFSSAVSPSVAIYTFPNGTPIPEDYVCPIHGVYCPDDPRPLEERPGYVAPAPEIRPTFVPRVLPDTSAEYISLFKRPASLPRSSRLAAFLNR